MRRERPSSGGLAGLLALALGCGLPVYADVSTEGAGGTKDLDSTTTTTTTTTTMTTSSTTPPETTSSTSSSSAGCPPDPPTNETDCDFVCTDDSAGTEPFVCDHWSQDCPGCAKCVAYDSDGDTYYDSTRCVPVTGAGQHGDPCTTVEYASGIDDCAFGHMCWFVDEATLQGTCVALCKGPPEAVDCSHAPNTTCPVAADGVLNLCIPMCDPLDSNCGEDELCIGDPMGDGFICVLDASGGEAPAGAPCDFANECNSGLFCASPQFATFESCADSLGCCTAFCDLGDGDGPCQALKPGFSCVPWYEMGMAPSAYEHVGGCGVPG